MIPLSFSSVAHEKDEEVQREQWTEMENAGRTWLMKAKVCEHGGMRMGTKYDA